MSQNIELFSLLTNNDTVFWLCDRNDIHSDILMLTKDSIWGKLQYDDSCECGSYVWQYWNHPLGPIGRFIIKQDSIMFYMPDFYDKDDYGVNEIYHCQFDSDKVKLEKGTYSMSLFPCHKSRLEIPKGPSGAEGSAVWGTHIVKDTALYLCKYKLLSNKLQKELNTFYKSHKFKERSANNIFTLFFLQEQNKFQIKQQYPDFIYSKKQIGLFYYRGCRFFICGDFGPKLFRKTKQKQVINYKYTIHFRYACFQSIAVEQTQL